MKPSPLTPIIQSFHTEVISKFASGFALKWKSESSVMKFLKVFLFWNPAFMSYFTTIFNTVYVPESWSEMPPLAQISIIAHETVHFIDSKKNPLFGFLYLIPQILFPILAICLAFVSPWFLFLILLSAVPLPAPFRFHYELRGYRMNLLIVEKIYGYAKGSTEYERQKKMAVDQMTDQWYFFAMPFKGYVTKKFEETGWESEAIYQETFAFCKRHGL